MTTRTEAPVVAITAPGTAPSSPPPLLPWPSPTSRPQPGRPMSPGLSLEAPAPELPAPREPWRCASTQGGCPTRVAHGTREYRFCLREVACRHWLVEPGRAFEGGMTIYGVPVDRALPAIGGRRQTPSNGSRPCLQGHGQALRVHPGCLETFDGSKARPGPSWRASAAICVCFDLHDEARPVGGLCAHVSSCTPIRRPIGAEPSMSDRDARAGGDRGVGIREAVYPARREVFVGGETRDARSDLRAVAPIDDKRDHGEQRNRHRVRRHPGANGTPVRSSTRRRPLWAPRDGVL